MCGIAGIVARADESQRMMEPLRRMQAALRHRGPDDEGIYWGGFQGAGGAGEKRNLETRNMETGSAGWKCGLAHTRLSIIDLSPAGHQPMSSPEGRFHITFNGEIYNFRELRADLEAVGEIFRTQTDTEVLLRLYERCGPDCLRKLAGMFALAIWDEREESCFLARDPFGIKPLYFCAGPLRLAFASEVRALLAGGLALPRLSRPATEDYLLFGSVPEPETIIEGVRELPAGGWMLWQKGKTTEGKFFEVQFRAEPPDGLKPVAETRAALEESIRRHFVSDVPVGVFLSGGIDSTALLALARHIGIENIRTFSISFDSPELNEGDMAARTARHFATEHHDWRLTAAEGKELLGGFIDHLDQPSVDGFNAYCVSKWAHDCGAKVVLSGLGGDEFFGGYGTFQKVPRLAALGRWSTFSEIGRKLAAYSLQRVIRTPGSRRLGNFFAGHSSIGTAYQTVRGIFTPAESGQLLQRYFPDEPGSQERPICWTVPAQPTPQDVVSYLEISRYMRNQLLRDGDVMSMAWGLELRVPLVDPRLAETLLNIPAAIRLQRGKKLLCDAVPEIPAEVALHPKRGFSFPFEEWSKAAWRSVFARLDAASPIRLQTWYRRWALFALESFMERNHIDSPRLAKVKDS